MSEHIFVPIVGKELYHWKYLRKYRKNGKWRYVYADKKTHDKIDSYNFASRVLKWQSDSVDNKTLSKKYSRKSELYNVRRDSLIDRNTVTDAKDFVSKYLKERADKIRGY